MTTKLDSGQERRYDRDLQPIADTEESEQLRDIRKHLSRPATAADLQGKLPPPKSSRIREHIFGKPPETQSNSIREHIFGRKP